MFESRYGTSLTRCISSISSLIEATDLVDNIRAISWAGIGDSQSSKEKHERRNTSGRGGRCFNGCKRIETGKTSDEIRTTLQ